MCKQRGPQSPENTVSLGHGVIDAKGMVGRVEGRWEVAERTHGMVTVALGGPLAPLGTEGHVGKVSFRRIRNTLERTQPQTPVGGLPVAPVFVNHARRGQRV